MTAADRPDSTVATGRTAADAAIAIADASNRQLATVRQGPVIAGLGVLLLVWLISAHWLWVTALTDEQPIYLEPQGSVRAVLAEAWADTGKPALPIEEFDDVPADLGVALVPRDAALVGDEIVPKDFAYPVAAAAVVAPLGQWGQALLPPFISLLASIAVGACVVAITRLPVAGAVTALLAQTSLVWWSASYGGMNFTPAAIVFGFSALFVLIQYRERDLPGLLRDRFLVAGFLGGIAGGWHYGTLPWWGGILLAACIGTAARGPEIVRRLLATGVGAFVGFVPVLLFNRWLYGSITATGYSEFNTILEAIGWQGESVGFSFSSARRNLLTYGLRPEIIPFVVLAVYGFRSLPDHGIVLRRAQVGAILAGGLALVAVSSGSTLWGTSSFQTNASFIRYLAPCFALLLVLAVLGLVSWWQSGVAVLRLTAVTLVVLIVPINLVTIFTEANGLADTKDLIDKSRAQREEILAVVPEDGFVITRRLDKILFPSRSTLIAAYLRTETPPSDEPIHLYDTFPDMERVASTSVALSGLGPVYLMNDTGWVDEIAMNVLVLEMDRRGRCVIDTGVDRLYLLGPCPTP